MSNANQELENALESIICMIGSIIKQFFISLWRGMRRLKTKGAWIGLGLSFAVTLAAYILKFRIFQIQMPIYIQYLIYVTTLCFPVLYLICLGNSQGRSQQEYNEIFKEIGFMGRSNKYPFFCGIQKEGKKQIYIFKSTIPLQEWRGAKERLETGLDCNILKIEHGSNKQLVRLVTVPTDCVIPKKIDWSDTYTNLQDGIVTIGQGALDKIEFDLNRVPHVLVAGETGSGKSVILRAILWQMINQGSRVYMIDFKGGVEFGRQYEQFGEVITERDRALEVLDMLVQENEKRLKLFRDMEVKNLREYNRKTKDKLCRIGVFSDEVAEMLDKTGVSKENKAVYEAIEGKLSTLARLSRATGINLFLGIQRPDAKILTGQIKNNVPVRISGRFADRAASEIVLGNSDAVELPDIKGRFLYKLGNETIEFQAYYFDDERMLHPVDVDIGHMLIEGGKKRTCQSQCSESLERKETSPPAEEEKRPEKTKKSVKTVIKNKTKTKPVQAADKVPDVCQEISNQDMEQLLAEMDRYDLDLNFWDMEGKESE